MNEPRTPLVVLLYGQFGRPSDFDETVRRLLEEAALDPESPARFSRSGRAGGSAPGRARAPLSYGRGLTPAAIRKRGGKRKAPGAWCRGPSRESGTGG